MILLEEHDGFIRNSKKAEQISVYLSEHTYLKPHITILSKVWVWNRRNWYFKIIYVEDKIVYLSYLLDNPKSRMQNNL